jgi:hypothetical protein
MIKVGNFMMFIGTMYSRNLFGFIGLEKKNSFPGFISYSYNIV